MVDRRSMAETEFYPTQIELDEYEQKDEAGLINAAKDDPNAFGILYRRYVQSVYKYFLNRTWNRSIAEDLTAQTFLAALENIHRYRDNGHFTAWLFTIARRKAADHFRRNHRENTELDADLLFYKTDFLQDIAQREMIHKVGNLFETLCEKDKELIRLRYVAALPYREIAVILRKSEGAVKKATYRLIARMKKDLEIKYE